MARTCMVSALIIALTITAATGKSLPKASVHGIGQGSRPGSNLVEDPFLLLEDPMGSDDFELADWLKIDEEGLAESFQRAPLRSDFDSHSANKVAAATDDNGVWSATVWVSRMILRALFLLVVGLGIERFKAERSEKGTLKIDDVPQQHVVEKPQPIEYRDVCGCTSLHFAVHSGRAAELETLLNRGVDVNVRDDWDETALHFAARRGDVSMCKLLLAAGADIDAVNANGETPLLVAGRAKQEVTSEFLLDKGATLAGGASADELPGTLNILLFCRMMQPN